jgi:hypothetical protein
MACEEFRESMLDALYGESDATGARAWAIHQQQCAACRDEYRALRGLRRDLAAWTVPSPAGMVRAGLWSGGARTWLPLAAAIAIGVAAAFVAAGSQERVDVLAAALRAQEQRHRAEIAALKETMGASRSEGEATLEDVRRLIRESEARQSVAMDASFRGLAERSEAQRREDMAQVSAGLSYLEGRTGLQVARTTELMGHVLSASQKR